MFEFLKEKIKKLDKNKEKKDIFISHKNLFTNTPESFSSNTKIENLHIGSSADFSFESDPIISDDVIYLVSNPFKINNGFKHYFDIILNDTKEKVGYISFDYSCDVKSKNSCGNVFYGIKKDYQNNGYATRALRLLKKFLQNSHLKCNKDLYFWVAYYNEPSKKVILNNGGEIVKEGSPITDKSISKPYMLRIKI